MMNWIYRFHAPLIITVLALSVGFLGAQALIPVKIGDRTMAMMDHDPDYSRVIFAGGVSGYWLSVERHNANDHTERGFDPSYVTVRSMFKPVITKHANEWEIEFTSNLPKPDLP